MPIVTRKPSAPNPIDPIQPKIEHVEHKSNVVDTKYTPRSSLLKYVEGAIWTVNYYSQVLDTDNATYTQDIGQLATYQQYKKIHNLELRVDSALSSSQTPETKGFVVKGSAILPLSVIPNEGDLFAADVGDGREGIFQVDNSEKRSIFKESVYFIEYTMLYFSDTSPDRKNDLESKVSTNYYYVKELAQYGQDAILTDVKVDTLKRIRASYHRLKRYYFNWFFSKEYSTILLPGQDYPTYDSNVVKAISSIYLTNEVYEYKLMRGYNIEDDLYLRNPTIWDVLLQKDIHMLNEVYPTVGVTGTDKFGSDPMIESIFYSGIRSIIYPVVTNNAIDENLNGIIKAEPIFKLETVASRFGNVSTIADSNTIDILGKQVTIAYPIADDNYYVFSENFYENTSNMSLIEAVTMQYLKGEAINQEHVLTLMDNIWKWGALERYYYSIVLLILSYGMVKDI